MMKFVSKQKNAIEVGFQLESLNDIKLIGIDQLSEKSDYYKKLINSNHISEENSFSNVFECGSKILYQIDLYHEGSCDFSEVGIGILIEEDGEKILRRIKPIKIILGGIDNYDISKLYHFKCCAKDIVIVTSYNSHILNELLFEDNCIITSVSHLHPTCVKVEENSILGRNDGDLENIPLDSLSSNKLFVKSAIESICKTTRQLILQSKALCVSALQLRPSNYCPEKEGIMKYNKDRKCIEFFDGENWNTIEHRRSLY